ncbi:hypothetical protein QCA50_011912 [Cerrena zonata]|uniref:NADP-dependent oxidoreductase domain-containing protein n=1 Tax=Cerrena zonata TaxID=2478898 RepID=A0AAW0G7W3_9APHY
MLTGRYRSPDDFEADDFRRRVPRYSAENFPNILKLVDGLTAIANRHNSTAGKVALAWVLAQGEDVIPIPGTTRIQNLKENLDALNVRLTDEEIDEIRRLSIAANVAQGDRYPPALSALLFGSTPALEK